MQTRMPKAHPSSLALTVPGKHAKGATRNDQPRTKACRILFLTLLLGGLAAGSAAASQVTGTGRVSTVNQATVGSVNSPWMY